MEYEYAYESAGGGIRNQPALYVERPVDHELIELLRRSRDVIIITAPKQSGKTSLLYRTSNKLADEKMVCCYVEFAAFMGSSDENIKTAEKWYEALLIQISSSLKLDTKEAREWIHKNQSVSMLSLFSNFFRHYIRPQIKGTLIFIFDEIDLVQKYNYFTDIFFEGIRDLAQDRFQLDMSFVLCGVNHPADLHSDSGVFSFNIGRGVISIEDFDSKNKSVVSQWASPYEIVDQVTREEFAKTVLQFTNGHPYLTARILDDALREEITTLENLSVFLRELVTSAKDRLWLWSHFRYPEDFLTRSVDFVHYINSHNGYELLLKGPVLVSSVGLEFARKLITVGLAKHPRDNKEMIKIRSPMYAAIYDAEWLRELAHKFKTRGLSTSIRSRNYKTEKRKRICIINTGGMISTEIQADGSVGIPMDLSDFFANFPNLYSIAEISTLALISKDSSDINPDDWEKLADVIYAKRHEGFDGFVVAHGTDTLPHSASAVAFALGEDLNFPVVFVGSQLGPHQVHGDAQINLMRAATVATKKIPEVVCVVGDEIHRGVRVQKKSDYRLNCFHSPTWQPLGIISDDIDINEGDLRVVDKRREMSLRNKFSRHVFKIGLYPGLDPNYLMPLLDRVEHFNSLSSEEQRQTSDHPIDGVVIETLGIGNVPTEGKWSLIPFITRARELDVPVLLASQFPIQTRMTKTYEPARPPLMAGAIAALNMSTPAAITKFMWVIPQVLDRIERKDLPAKAKLSKIEEMMSISYVGELDTQKELDTHTKDEKNV